MVTPDECLFVRPGWQSHLAWSLWSSPYILKGRAVSRPASVTVTGRLSVAASIGIPAVIAWLVAGGALMSDPSSITVALSVAASVAFALLTRSSVRREITDFRLVWANVNQSLRR